MHDLLEPWVIGPKHHSRASNKPLSIVRKAALRGLLGLRSRSWSCEVVEAGTETEYRRSLGIVFGGRGRARMWLWAHVCPARRSGSMAAATREAMAWEARLTTGRAGRAVREVDLVVVAPLENLSGVVGGAVQTPGGVLGARAELERRSYIGGCWLGGGKFGGIGMRGVVVGGGGDLGGDILGGGFTGGGVRGRGTLLEANTDGGVRGAEMAMCCGDRLRSKGLAGVRRARSRRGVGVGRRRGAEVGGVAVDRRLAVVRRVRKITRLLSRSASA